MKTLWISVLAVLPLLSLSLYPAPVKHQFRTEAVKPVLVELFTSEGCSSCPPADAILRDLADKQPLEGVQIIALGLHVDYWNRLGWKDVYSDPAFTRRQAAYAERLAAGNYTPQAVVQGRAELVGGQRGSLLKTIREADAPTVLLNLDAHSDGITVRVQRTEGDKGRSLDLWLAEVQPGIETAVKRGENAGATLHHAPLARRLQKLGTLPPGTAAGRFPTDAALKGRYLVAFAQEGDGGAIVGVVQEGK